MLPTPLNDAHHGSILKKEIIFDVFKNYGYRGALMQVKGPYLQANRPVRAPDNAQA